VADVQGGQVEEVDDQDDLSPAEMSADKQHDECELQEVVENEVASNTSSSIDIVGITREEMPNISDLQEENDNPMRGRLAQAQSSTIFRDGRTNRLRQ